MSVSIVIKTLNEQDHIEATLSSALDALSELSVHSAKSVLSDQAGEIILADGGSTDQTIEIASAFPVRIVQLTDDTKPSCGLGPQLGFQYARYDYICLIDGDMELAPSFLPRALAYLNVHQACAGVSGHVAEMQLDTLEYRRRVERQALENKIGNLDRLNGGGLYRRSAIEAAGYFSDRNLHGYEEYELGLRLRKAGWTLHRFDLLFVRHYGHSENSYRLLLRRWRSKYIFGIGELVRAAGERGSLGSVIRELPELRLWGLVYVWWAFGALLFVVPGGFLWPLMLNLLLFWSLVGLMSWRKGGASMGLYTVVSWIFHAAALPLGILRARLDPTGWIESVEMKEIGDD